MSDPNLEKLSKVAQTGGETAQTTGSIRAIDSSRYSEKSEAVPKANNLRTHHPDALAWEFIENSEKQVE